MNKNETLHIAKKSKKDEFYTQYVDIERELQHYTLHFKNKIVYCNCDNENSNFFKYFVDNFSKLELKKLIISSYNINNDNSYYIEYNGYEKYRYNLNCDGDFRNNEIIELLKKSDIIVTNPPFSLFREYIQQLVEYNKKFLVIGNINSITYKEIFKLIKDNNVWLGINIGRGISGFIVPKDYELYGTEVRIDEFGNKIISPNNCLWLTNLELSKRNENIILSKKYDDKLYPKYDNYNAINVNKTKDIPKDYDGIIGVPITFLHKYNPNQFEIIRFRKGDNEKDLSINGKCPFFRILIKKI